MELIGINPHKTNSVHDVSFVVDSAPEQEVLDKVKLKSVQLEMIDGYLQVTVSSGGDPVGLELINVIEENYAEAYEQHHAELQESERKHRSMLDTVRRNTRLDVMKDA